MEKSRRVRVFVSSTFLDMVDDRNELDDRVWPALRVLCQSLNVDFVAVDLRWGITEEQSSRNEVLGLVLDEVQNCKPYFVAMLGERYGATIDTKAFPPDLLAREAWVGAYRDRSITELEIRHGVLNSPADSLRAFFYFRNPEYAVRIGGFFVSHTPVDSNKLGALKNKIDEDCSKRGFTRRGYKSPRDLADLVLADLSEAIKSDFPPDPSIDPTDYEQDAFAATRRRIYLHSELQYARLDAHAKSLCGPLAVIGEAGLGKTALLANWSPRWRSANPGDFLFEHFATSSPDSATHWNLMRHLVREIKRWTADDAPFPDSNERLLGEFELWLRKLRAEVDRREVRAVVILDGLDQFDDQDHAKLLGWLPSAPWGGALRLIVSCRTPSPNEASPLRVMKDRGYDLLDVDALDQERRNQFIIQYLDRFRKTVEPEQLRELAAIKAAENPLFLKILLDELIVTGQYGQAMGTILAAYAEAGSVPDLLDRVLSRWQAAYERDRPNMVAEALALIWCARRGLSEDELLRCMRGKGEKAMPFAVWSPLRYALWESMTNRRGVLNFAHSYLREAVKRKFLREDALENKYRARLAEEFDYGQPTPRSCDEFPWLLSATRQFSRLRAFLLTRRPFLMLTRSQRADLYTYWQELDTPDNVGSKYEDAFDTWNLAEGPKDERERSLDAFDLALFLDSLGAAGSAERLIRISLEAIERYSGSDAPDVAQVYRTQARLLKQKQRFPEAVSALHKALVINEKWRGRDDTSVADVLVSIAQLLDAMTLFDQAMVAAKRAAEIYKGKGETRAFGRAMVSIASIHKNAGRFDLAYEALHQAQTVARLREFGPSEALAMYHSYCGEICAARKQHTEAARSFRQSADTFILLYGKSNLAVLRQINNLAVTYLEQSRLQDALGALRECVGILDQMSDTTNADYGIACSNLSCVLSGAHEYADALKYSERAVKCLAAFGRQARGSMEYAASLNHHGLALLRNSRKGEAIDSWCNCVKQMLVAIRISGPATEDLVTLMSNVVGGLAACQLGGKQTYEVLAPRFEAAQMLDIQTELARRAAGQPDSLGFAVGFLTPVALDLLGLDMLTDHQILRKEINRQVDFHLGRVEAGPAVPLRLCQQTREIVDPWLDAIAYEAMQMDGGAFTSLHFRQSAPENAVFFLVSIFDCAEGDVKAFYVQHSQETGIGYVSYMTHWINNWPSPQLKMIFHLIICRRNGRRMYHSCFWDNANGATGAKEFAVLPIELLTQVERSSIR